MNQIDLITDAKTIEPEHREIMLSRLWRMLLRIPNIVDTVERVAKYQGCHTNILAITDIDTHDVAVYVRYSAYEFTLWVEESKTGLNVHWPIWLNLQRLTIVDADTYIATVKVCADGVCTPINKLTTITEPFSDEEIVEEVMEFLYDYSDFGEYNE
jgi:hypothetical protein